MMQGPDQNTGANVNGMISATASAGSCGSLANFILPNRPRRPTSVALEKARLLKLKTEQYYQNLMVQAKERHQRTARLEEALKRDGLSEAEQEAMIRRHRQTEADFERCKRIRLTSDDFRTLRVIGKGAFGVVKVVEKIDNGKVYAMKTMRKIDMIKHNQMAHVRSERDFLTEANSPWVVELFYSFQDPNYLNLVMEYLPGGDLMSMLIKYDTFSEDMARFYVAEMVLAIESVHTLGFIHRDIKPDNILLDAKGHVKLTDFGLSTGFHATHETDYYERFFAQHGISVGKKSRSWEKMGKEAGLESSKSNPSTPPATPNRIDMTLKGRDGKIDNWKKNRRALAYSTVGTPDYVAPEVFRRAGYGKECDWWSLGAIMFEMVYGYPPFMAENPNEVYRKIINHKDYLMIPSEPRTSEACRNLIRRLLTDADKRLGLFGAHEIKSHPFFVGVDWDGLRRINAPFQPHLKSESDTTYFPELEDLNLDHLDPALFAGGDSNTMKQQKDLAFIGYTYRRFKSLKGSNASSFNE